MKRDLRLIHFAAGSARRAACLCILPLALVPLLPRTARHGIIISVAPTVDGARSLGSGNCEQYRRAYRTCLAEGSAGAVPSPPRRGDAGGLVVSPPLPGAGGLLPSCDELRAGARQMLASTPCKL